MAEEEILTEEFKTMIKEYVKLDDTVSEINKELKELRAKKNEFGETIKEKMIATGHGKLVTTLGNFKISVRHPKKSLSRENIISTIREKLSEEKSNELIEDIFKEEEVKEIKKLERTKLN
jgi:seryl-tRNA synthetase